VGHSIAGAEMTRFAVLYPQRVAKLVYLDSAIDYKDSLRFRPTLISWVRPPAARSPPSNGEQPPRHPELSKVKAPALAFVVVYDELPQARREDDPA